METTLEWKSHSIININQSPNCPRCASSNTKFCYYNNYSLSQPRHFCKDCSRYWNNGGSLRNVPIGGTCRKSRRATRDSKNRHQSVPVKSTNDQYSDKNRTDIDLAAVYAKYVNLRNAEIEEYSSSTDPGASSCASSLSFSSDHSYVQGNSLEIDDRQIQKDQTDLISWIGIEAVLDPHELCNMYDDINIQDLVCTKIPIAFEMHRMLGGDHDFVWSDHSTKI